MKQKKLSEMTWTELRDEMSIAGSPDKMIRLGMDIEQLIASRIDATNRAELTNVELMLRRLIAEVRLQQKLYDKTH